MSEQVPPPTDRRAYPHRTAQSGPCGPSRARTRQAIEKEPRRWGPLEGRAGSIHSMALRINILVERPDNHMCMCINVHQSSCR